MSSSAAAPSPSVAFSSSAADPSPSAVLSPSVALSPAVVPALDLSVDPAAERFTARPEVRARMTKRQWHVALGPERLTLAKAAAFDKLAARFKRDKRLRLYSAARDLLDEPNTTWNGAPLYDAARDRGYATGTDDVYESESASDEEE